MARQGSLYFGRCNVNDMHGAVAASSGDGVTTWAELGLKRTLLTWLPTFREHSCSPEAASQIKTVLSQLPLTILVPSGLKHTDQTRFVCPLSDDLTSNVLAS